MQCRAERQHFSLKAGIRAQAHQPHDLAARKLTPDAPNNKNEERHRLHEKMEREGSASADITLRTSIRMSDEAFAAALEKAKAEGRDAVHVRAWLALPAACPSQSHITLDGFTETPAHIAAEDAPQRTVCWEADLTENRTFGAEYSYRETAVYADPLSFTPDAEQPDLYTGEEAPHNEDTVSFSTEEFSARILSQNPAADLSGSPESWFGAVSATEAFAKLIVGELGMTLKEANQIIWDHKLNCLPIIDDNQRLQYFVFRKDLKYVGGDDEKGEEIASFMNDAWCSFIKTARFFTAADSLILHCRSAKTMIE